MIPIRPASVAFLAACALGQSTQQPVFRSQAELVRVEVTATENGVPVTGLTAADFSIFDDGVRQQIDLIRSDDLPILLVMALDVSGSVAGERLVQLKNAASQALAGLNGQDAAALVTFGHEIEMAQGPPAVVAEALTRASSAGQTSLVDGVAAGLLVAAETRERRPMVLVFSDGVDTSSVMSADVVTELASRTVAPVYAVGVGRAADDRFLKSLADVSGGRVFRAELGPGLSAVFAGILSEFRQRYLLGYTPAGVPRGGWHSVDVRTTRRNLTLKFRERYFRGD